MPEGYSIPTFCCYSLTFPIVAGSANWLAYDAPTFDIGAPNKRLITSVKIMRGKYKMPSSARYSSGFRLIHARLFAD